MNHRKHEALSNMTTEAIHKIIHTLEKRPVIGPLGRQAYIKGVGYIPLRELKAESLRR